MSMFICARCDNIRDSDDGCKEFGPRLAMLICAECADELEQDAEDEALPERVIAGGTP